jgi:hypothetical protein
VGERVLGFSKQAFFKWRAAPVSQRDWDNAHLTNAAIDLHLDDPGSGYRFIADEIESEAGLKASERRAWRLRSKQGLWSLHSKKRGLNRKAGPPVHDDLVLRDFTATRLNELWLTDITERWTAWIPSVVATRTTGRRHAGAEVHGTAKGRVHGDHRSRWICLPVMLRREGTGELVSKKEHAAIADKGGFTLCKWMMQVSES